MANLLVEVAVNSAPGCARLPCWAIETIAGTLTYQVPLELASQVKEGSLVLVTVGKQLATGLVVALPDKADRAGLKAIKAVLERDFLPPGMVELSRYLAERYFCPLAVALNTLLPPATGRRLERRWCWLPGGGGETEEALNLANCLPPPAGAVAAYLASRRVAGEGQLQQFGRRQELSGALASLKSHGLVREEWSWREAPRERRPRWVVPGEGVAAAIEALVKKAPRQAAILKDLLDGGPRPVTSFAAGGGYAALKRLEEHGLITITPLPPGDNKEICPEIKLNAAQEEAVGIINAALGRGGTFLLHGVTGSGKTEVYLRCAGEALAKGYQVLFLVPEHALIPQMVARLRQRLGDRVAVIHGDLPAGERATVWEQARRGEIQVITGSRSALFAPFPRLGLIVVDEEHAGSYKQDTAPRYDAREVAIKRGQLEGAVVVLGSATPSTESFYLARRGKIQLLQLPRRAGNVSLPRVEIVDLRAEFRAGHHGILSRRLEQGITAALAAGQQAILFLNRRGYAPHVLCRHCGHVPLCRHCAVALTYHQDGTLRCHYCGYVQKAGANCPVCGGTLVRLGSGTQRVEEEVRALWPGARILRADGDTTARKGQWEKIYRTFAAGQVDILIGTQTITKGMDFPGVTLVGVVNADLTLYQPDFRARERTFQLLTQVAGRAGRRTGEGEVIIQTYNPEDPAITLAATQDYHKFYEQEIAMRRNLSYPPFIKLVRLGFTGPDEARVIETAHEVAGLINSKSSKIQVLGPAPGYPSRVKDNYRWQLILKVPGWSRHKGHLAASLAAYRNRHDVRMIVDVGPINPW
ncbi:replication restart helicase PriA [Neomoorella mulderi]|uniref:Replication restart protein PriA n=1 Tax=Moorella mulderi DSM 14980 TaxID=1122241 RepID=A0A151AY08_9FIRM|nr:primosomal protein N' [Moorella mulderi]KYH32535.1 primosomal protein N' [Moorella mulderi DSM 14980]